MVWLASSVRDQVSKIADAKTLDKLGAMDEWMYGLVYPLTTFRHAEGAERQSLSSYHSVSKSTWAISICLHEKCLHDEVIEVKVVIKITI